MITNQNFWENRRVLLTGHTGFKGSWMSLLLSTLGAKTTGLALPNINPQNLYSELPKGIWTKEYFVDIRNFSQLRDAIIATNPQIVLHFAAQASVLESYRHPVLTWETNVMGTQNVLEAIGSLKDPVSALFVTTDKVYRNDDQGKFFKEFDPLGGIDPYSTSKAAAELVINTYTNGIYFDKTHIRICSARAGNVIGGGDWLENRIIPDIARAAKSGKRLLIRNPESIRPWQHVIDPLLGYLTLVEHLAGPRGSEVQRPFNFGPDRDKNRTVLDLVNTMQRYLDFKYEIQNESQFHEAKTLNLDISDAKTLLSWKPLLDFESTMELTGNWYADYQRGNGMKITKKQLEKVLNSAY